MIKRETHIPIHDLLKKINNKFLLTVAIAQRARQIKEGANPLTKSYPGRLPVIAAMAEILEDKVGIEIGQDRKEDLMDSINETRRKAVKELTTRRKAEAVSVAEAGSDEKKKVSRIKKEVGRTRALKKVKSLGA